MKHCLNLTRIYWVRNMSPDKRLNAKDDTVARLLNEKKIPNPTEYKHLEGLRYKQPDSTNSTLWKYSAISSMLTNEMYIGNMVQGKYGSISLRQKKTSHAIKRIGTEKKQLTSRLSTVNFGTGYRI